MQAEAQCLRAGGRPQPPLLSDHRRRSVATTSDWYACGSQRTTRAIS
jgi:hypothetical protein